MKFQKIKKKFVFLEKKNWKIRKKNQACAFVVFTQLISPADESDHAEFKTS